MKGREVRPGWWVASMVLGLGVLALPALGARQATGQAGGAVNQGSLPQHFTALAVNMSNIPTGTSGRAQTVEIEITRWSTDAERDRMITLLKDKGQDALLKALQDAPKVGYIRTPDSLAYDLHFAREREWGDGGRRIFLATDRPIGFWEASNRPRSLDYPLTLIEMRLNHDGKGEGKLTVAAKAGIEADTLVLENYADQPVRLTEVTREK